MSDVLTAKNKEILLNPIRRGRSEIKINFGLNTSQKKIKATSVIRIKPKPKPNKEINHQSIGSRTGERQANRKTTEAIIFKIKKIVFVIRR